MANVRTINGIYENGTIRFPSTVIRLGHKLPLRNHTRLRFQVEFPSHPSPVLETFGIIRVPKRLARWAAESPEFSLFNAP